MIDSVVLGKTRSLDGVFCMLGEYTMSPELLSRDNGLGGLIFLRMCYSIGPINCNKTVFVVIRQYLLM